MMGVTVLAAAVVMAQIVIPPGGLWGPVTGIGTAAPPASVSLPIEAGPRSTGEMATVNPASTLTADEFDVVVAASAADASKFAGETHVHPAPAAPAPAAIHHHHDPEPAPKPKASPKKPAAKKPAAKKAPAGVVYTCPMHPEVTSSKPGTCPKCGMSLVRKGSK